MFLFHASLENPLIKELMLLHFIPYVPWLKLSAYKFEQVSLD